MVLKLESVCDAELGPAGLSFEQWSLKNPKDSVCVSLFFQKDANVKMLTLYELKLA